VWPSSTAPAGQDTTAAGVGPHASSTRTLSDREMSSGKLSSATEERKRPLSRGATSAGQRGGGRRGGRRGSRGSRRSRGRGRSRLTRASAAAELMAEDGLGVDGEPRQSRAWRISARMGPHRLPHESRRGRGSRGGLVGITRQAAGNARKEMQVADGEDSSHGRRSSATLVGGDRNGAAFSGLDHTDNLPKHTGLRPLLEPGIAGSGCFGCAARW
jgi:hypothetical protein